MDFSTSTGGNTAGGNITFTGATNNTFSGTGVVTDLRNLTITKGTGTVTSSSPVLEMSLSNLTVRGLSVDPVGFLTLNNGIFKISGSNTASSVVFLTTGYSIASTAGFWLNNANFTVTGLGGSPTMSGLLRMTAGTYNVGTASGNAMSGAATSIFIIEGGTLNFTGRLNVTSAGASFNMSAGIINVTTVGNASSATAGFGFTSATSVFTMSGGTINLVNRATGATILDYNVATTSPTITGGTLNVGTAATATNFNFGIQGAMPNVVVDNTTNNKTANLVATARVYGNLTINTGATFSGVASTITMFGNSTNTGNVINNGTITNTSGGGTNRFQFSGTYGAQNYSGAGVFGTAALPYSGLNLDNAVGVTFSSAVVATRANLFQGTNAGTNITLGGTTNLPFIQIGGTSTVNAGSFSSAPTFDVTAGLPSLLYSTALSAVTTGFEIPATRNIGSLSINNTNGVTLSGGALNLIGATPTFTMSSGNFNLGSNNLVLGASAAIPGTLTYTAGFITTATGTFTRWYPTTGLPTAVSTSIGYYPFASGSNNRQVQLFFSSATALSAGGTITVGHDNTTGLTSIGSFLDGGINVDKRSNANWPMSVGGGITLSGVETISAAIRADNVSAVVDFTQLRLIRAADAVATSANGTGSNTSPVLNRTALDITTIANTFYMGSTSANLGTTYTAITNGNWGDNGTWDLPGSPGASDNAIIPSPYNVTVDGATTPYQCNNLNINSGGTLTSSANTLAVNGIITNAGTVTANGGNITIAGASAAGVANTGTFNLSAGTVTVGPAGGGNRTFTNSTATGNLAVTGTGTLNINGNLSVATGSFFSQSGTSNINVDGNVGPTNSVITGTPLVNFASNNLTLTAGTLTVVDPHQANSAYSIQYNNASSVNLPTSYLIRFGDGISTETGGTNGFYLNTNAGAGRLAFGNVTIEGSATGTNRFVSLFTGAVGIAGNLVINGATGDLLLQSGQTLHAAGNITVNAGAFLSNYGTSVLALQSFASGTASATTLAQTISGSGTYRNALAPTANFFSLLINNNNASGVTLSTGSNLSISSALTLTAGVVNTNSTNVLTLTPTVTTPPNGSATSYVNGPLAIQVNTAINTSKTFAIGQGTFWRPLALAAFHSNGALQTYTAEVINGATGGTFNAPLVNINAARYFRIQNTNNIFSTTTATVQLSYGVDDLSASPAASARVAQSNTSNGTYISRGGTTTASPTTGIISATAITVGDDFFVIGNESNPPITWVGGNGVWSDPTMWSSNPVIPVSTDNITIAPGAAAIITVDGNYAVNDMNVGTNATINLGSNTLTVNRDYTQTAGTIDLGSGTHTVKRNFTKSGGTYTAGNSTTIFDGTAQAISATGSSTTFNNLTINGGTKTFTTGATYATSGNLSVAASGVIDLSAATTTTINVGGNLSYSATSGGANLGSLTLNLTNISTGAISSLGSGLVTPNIIIASTGVYSLASNFELSTGRTITLTTSGGRLNSAGFVLSGAGTLAFGNYSFFGVAHATGGFGAAATITNKTYPTTSASAYIDYNAAGNQDIDAASHNARLSILTGGSGIKTLNGALSIDGSSGNLGPALLSIGAGTTFADGGNIIQFTNSAAGYANVTVNGIYSSTGTGGFTYPGTSNLSGSIISFVDNTTFGDININTTSSTGTYSFRSLPAATTVNASIRNANFGGVAGGLLVLNASGTTNINVTGNVVIAPTTTSNSGGGFGGTSTTTGTVRVKGNISSTSTAATQPILNATGTNTLILDGAGAQSITLASSATILTGATLQVNNSSGVTFGDGTTKTFTISATGVVDMKAGNITPTGTTTLAYTSGAILRYSGAAAQTTGGEYLASMPAGVTVNINNANNVTLNANRTINGTLSFTSSVGRINTSTFTQVISSTGTVSGASQLTGWVNGNLQKRVVNGANIFETGTTVYAPATITMTGVSGTVDLTGIVTNGTPASEGTPIANSSGINQSAKCNHFWNLTKSNTGTFTSYTALFNFTNTTNTGSTANYIVRKYDVSPGWVTTTSSVAGTTITATGLTNFSDFAVGEVNTITVATEPIDVTICSGSNTTFNSTSISSPLPAVKWQRDAGGGFIDVDGVIDGGVYSTFATATLNITGATASMNGYLYRAVFTNINGTVNSTSKTLTINPAATANAGGPQTICAGNTVTLAGSIGGAATSGTWTGGAGTFTPNATTLNAVYTPTAAEITAGTVTLTLTTDDPTGPCGAVNANMIVTITASASSLAATGSCKNMNVGVVVTGAVYTDVSCNSIVKVIPSGATPVSGMVNSCVTIDATVQTYGSTAYVQRHFDITPAVNQSTATARVTLYALQSEFDAYNLANGTEPDLMTGPLDATGINNLRLTKYSGNGTAPGNYVPGVATFIDPSNTDIVWDAVNNWWTISFDVEGFSGFYIHSGLGVLPVTIEYFRGSKQATSNVLDWKITCTSAPSVTISLERSADGRSFTAIQDQNATAARCLQGFNYTDVSPLSGANYYRLKITTPDGQFRYSTIVVLLNKQKGFELISLAPNPVKNSAMLTLTSAKSGKIDIAVSDIGGKIVALQNVTVIAGNNPIDMNFTNLGAGTYSITAINADGERKTIRFVKY